MIVLKRLNYDFMLITPNLNAYGIFYERYVLSSKNGIAAGKVSKKMSEKVAKEMLKRVPKQDARPWLVKQRKLSFLPEKREERRARRCNRQTKAARQTDLRA
ncbi:MAG: hypothetical protein ACP5T3_03430 [Candidatus Micrarchaeia archaeon]